MIQDYLNKKTGKGAFLYDQEAACPNILLVTMDMVPPEFHNGGFKTETPSQKSLARDGVSFRRTFATSPLCGPSRASILTGRYSYITGNSERSRDGHRTELRSEDIIWPEYLKARGYHTRHIGKSHVGTEHFLRAFSENSSPWDRWSPPWYDEDLYIRFLRDKGLERFRFSREIRGLSWEGKRNGNSYGGWLADQQGKPFPEEATYPAFLVDRTIQTLDARGDRETPFYLQLDFFGPHQPFAVPGGWDAREEEIRKTVKLPASWQAWEDQGFPEETGDPRVYDLYRKNWGMRSREDMTDYLVANQLQYELLDKQLGRLLAYLKEQDLYDSTMILFTADHGEMNGRKGCIDKGAYLNPQVLQVPLTLKPAAGQQGGTPGTTVDDPCSLLDIGPTVLGAAGIRVPERLDGTDLFPAAAGGPRPEEKPVMFDVWNHVVPNPCVGRVFASQGGTYLYAYNTTSPKDELYDLSRAADLENLIDRQDPLRREAQKSLMTALSADERWDIYACYFKLEYARDLDLKPGDNQKFE